MKILVLNSGSSSIKYQLFSMSDEDPKVLYKGLMEEVVDYDKSLKNILAILKESKVINSLEDIDAFGHRIVHGGDEFSKPTLIDDNVISVIKDVSRFAPLHNMANLKGILTILALSPSSKQVAIFDTSFHQTMPKKAFVYPIDYKLYEENKIRRYGFHGTSHSYVAQQCSDYLNKPLDTLNLISVHLGNGASVCAIKNGKSIDTSMGLTPLEGLMMGTRCGDIDPAIVFYLENELNFTIPEVEDILNKKSGLLGVSGKSSDLREVIDFAKNGDEQSALALDIFAYRVKKYIGSYKFILDDVDAIIFTGGIGENSRDMRSMIMGNKIDNLKNNQKLDKLQEIQAKEFETKVLVIQTNEELEIANLTYKLII